MRRIVIDTNVLIAGLRSRNGASNRLLSFVGADMFVTAISVPLVLEYEEVTQRHAEVLPYSQDELHVLEIAVAAQCDTIVTFNRVDFPHIDRFGIQALTPGAFLKEVNP